jgi:general secretion pathway protein N
MTQSAGAKLLIAALGVVCVVLLGAAATPWLVDPLDYIDGPDDAGAVAVPASPATPRLDAPPAEILALLAERPLFTATRRPPPPAGTTEPAAAAPAPDTSLILGRYRLSGVVVTPDRRLVLLTRKGGSATIGVAKGEMLDGWAVTEVEREFIVFERDARKKTYFVRDSTEVENTTE